MTISLKKAPPAAPAPAYEIRIPFAGFYESTHAGEAQWIADDQLDLLDPGAPDYADQFAEAEAQLDAMNWADYFDHLAREYAAWFMGELCERAGFPMPQFRTRLDRPREYNFRDDEIFITPLPPADLPNIGQFIPVLSPGYITTRADLIAACLAHIEEALRTRDGFAPFITNRPDIAAIFGDERYLSLVLEVVAARYWDTTPNDLPRVLEEEFYDYAQAQGIYHAAYDAAGGYYAPCAD